MTCYVARPGVEWHIKLPYDRPPLNANDRPRDWRAASRDAKKVRDRVEAELTAHRLPAFYRCSVTLVYVPRTGWGGDPNNIADTLKRIQDAVVLAGIVPDDRPQYMDHVMPDIRPADRIRHGVYVRIVNTDPEHRIARPVARPMPAAQRPGRRKGAEASTARTPLP